jgi:hypothetical protein
LVLIEGIFQVPVIALFTKFDQFKLDIEMKLEEDGRDPEIELSAEVDRVTKKYYVGGLPNHAPFVFLESEVFNKQ